MLYEEKQKGVYLSILMDGKLHQTVTENTEGAIKREYETSSKEKGIKWEKIYPKVGGIIKSITFYKTDYGDQISIQLKDAEDVYFLNLNTTSRYASDVMKKLPNVNIDDYIIIAPFSFENDNNKNITGVSLYQGDKKIENYYYDVVNKKSCNGIPQTKKTWDKLTNTEQKKFWIDMEEFLVNSTKERFAKLNNYKQEIKQKEDFNIGDDFEEPKF